MTIADTIQQISPLSSGALKRLLDITQPLQLPKGHLLFQAGRIEHQLYIIEKGLVRAFAGRGEAERTFWFGQEGDLVLSMNSYVREQAGYESIELLEAGILHEVDTNALHQLFATDTELANWGRKFAEQELIRTEERLISRQCHSATERYQDLLHNHNTLLQRVSLRHIASYLGITPVSLSRIRSEIR